MSKVLFVALFLLVGEGSWAESWRLIYSDGASSSTCPQVLEEEGLKLHIETMRQAIKARNEAPDNHQQGYGTVETLKLVETKKLFLGDLVQGRFFRRSVLKLVYSLTDYYPNDTSDLRIRWECHYVLN